MEQPMERDVWMDEAWSTSLLVLGLEGIIVHKLAGLTGPYLAGGQGGQLPPLGKLNVDFFNEVFVFDGIFLVAILVQNLKKTG